VSWNLPTIYSHFMNLGNRISCIQLGKNDKYVDRPWSIYHIFLTKRAFFQILAPLKYMIIIKHIFIRRYDSSRPSSFRRRLPVPPPAETSNFSGAFQPRWAMKGIFYRKTIKISKLDFDWFFCVKHNLWKVIHNKLLHWNWFINTKFVVLGFKPFLKNKS